jgi:hypothetical protein
MSTFRSALLPLSFVCLLPACVAETAGESGDDEEVAVVDGVLLANNIMIANALDPSAIDPSAINPSVLVLNALALDALSPDALAAVQAAGSGGDLSRMFLQHVVGCAFNPTQSITLSWPGHQATYSGVLGLAPDWATLPLTDPTRQRLVSACMAARTNFYGFSVVISMRSKEEPIRSQTGSQELAAFPTVEGAFWGNLFAPVPYLNACHHPANVDAARAAYRDCAAGHRDGDTVVPCGMIALRGPCTTVCGDLTGSGQYYPSCTDRPGEPGSQSTTVVITTALP